MKGLPTASTPFLRPWSFAAPLHSRASSSAHRLRCPTTQAVDARPHSPRRPFIAPLMPASRCTSSAVTRGARLTRLHNSSAQASPSASEASSLHVAPVPHRALLSISGPDTAKLLQGLVTHDVRRMEKGERLALYATFLNPQGRVVAPTFLLPRPPNAKVEDLLVDVDARSLDSLVAFVRRFKLRSKVKLQDVSQEWQVVALWGDEAIREGAGALQEGVGEDGVVFRDPRSARMGWRAVVRRAPSFAIPPAFASLNAQPASSDEYTLHRVLNGVPDGPEDLVENHGLPLEANLDYMDGVDFRKGCYVGQELTARTHHKGVIRKRVLPVTLHSMAEDDAQLSPAIATLARGDDAETDLLATPPIVVDRGIDTASLPPPGSDIRSVPVAAGAASPDASSTAEQPAAAAATPRSARSAGKLLSGSHNVFLALLRLEHVARALGIATPQVTPADGAAGPAAPDDDVGGASPSPSTPGRRVALHVQGPDGRKWRVQPHVPTWWPEDPKREL